MRINRLAFGVLVLALFASLMANFLIGGIAVGHAAKPLPVQAEIVSLGPILKSLPEADRRIMRRAFAQHRDDIQKASQAARASATALRAALKANPYDPAKVQSALDDYRRDFHALHDLEQTVFWGAVDHLSPQGRTQLAESTAFEKTLK